MTNPSPSTDALAETLAALEAERQRRMSAGQWSRATLPKLVAIPETGETVEVAQQRALYAHLADNPDAPKAIAAYDWIVYEIIDPKPAVEPPGEQYAPDHAAARDVTPPPYRPPSPPRSPARSLPPAPGAGALSADPARMNIPRDVHAAERRRTQRFNDDDWGSPQDHPIRYPRGRTGW
jgi:hypothetical protein